MNLRRIDQEYNNLQKDPLNGCSAAPVNEKDLQNWDATIAGPRNTTYENGSFELSIRYPDDYPHNALQVKFLTPIFHPNISPQGELRLAELDKLQWSPVITIRIVLISLQAMLSDPNLEEGCVLNEEAAKLYLEDVATFEEKARQWTATHAIQKTGST